MLEKIRADIKHVKQIMTAQNKLGEENEAEIVLLETASATLDTIMSEYVLIKVSDVPEGLKQKLKETECFDEISDSDGWAGSYYRAARLLHEAIKAHGEE